MMDETNTTRRTERQMSSHIPLKQLDGRRVTVPRYDPIKWPTLKPI
ncbi:MAG: hypothetical protein WAL66_00775 [Nitrososphaeraceae archaeon]|jgi:hypothetical protein